MDKCQSKKRFLKRRLEKAKWLIRLLFICRQKWKKENNFLPITIDHPTKSNHS